MKTKLILASLLVAAALTVYPKSAMATANTKLDLIQDVAAGPSGVLDMEGPTGYGFVNFNQNDQGDLRLTISLKNAEPNTEYSGVFTVCGPDHSSACGYIDVGDLTTNNQGNGNATIIVPVETLQDNFGSGAKTDHFDLLKDVGDLSAGVYTATGLNYVVP